MFRTVARRWLVTLIFCTVGILHFVKPEFFVHIMPAYLPWHEELVQISGFFEIAGGVGVQIPKLRKAAGYGLLALLLAVFPANINMAVNHVGLPDGTALPSLALWARLPLQFVIMWFVWRAAIKEPEASQ